MPRRPLRCLLHAIAWVLLAVGSVDAADHVRSIQEDAVRDGRSDTAHWGPDPDRYVSWSTHSNRLIPVYTFGTRGAGKGVDLDSYTGEQSAYRDERRVREVYGYVPSNTVQGDADYMDQTDLYRLQRAALETGRKHVVLVVFDGMDWQTSQAAAIAGGAPVFDAGRGTGLHFLDEDTNTQFGWMVTSPHNDGTNVDVDRQTVANPGGKLRGGYSAVIAGGTPWSVPSDPQYLIGKSSEAANRHAYTDSSSSATSLTAGIKTYNGAVNIDTTGIPVSTIAHLAQQRGLSVGAVTSVPISHATPASAYAHNVSRDDYQDLSRDLLGRPSIAHPEQPLPGMDVVIGTGFGVTKAKDGGQGENFVPGNRYLTEDDLRAVDLRRGGRYVVATRQEGRRGTDVLAAGAAAAARDGHRLLGYFGVGDDVPALNGNLPFATADGDHRPAPGKSGTIEYSEADVRENPTLAEMTRAALTVLSRNPEGFWLLVEAGDVDWANHDNNLDASIGAVHGGDAAFRAVTEWVDTHSNWDETIVIVTADHGHYLVLDDPRNLIPPRD
jgi:alkaline phosphatase